MNEEMNGDWTLPPEDRILKQKTEELILEVIKDKKISYPAEICGETGLSRTTVFDKLSYMKTQGKLLKINLTNMKPPKELLDRRASLWTDGIKGDMIRRMSWYMINPDYKGDDILA